MLPPKIIQCAANMTSLRRGKGFQTLSTIPPPPRLGHSWGWWWLHHAVEATATPGCQARGGRKKKMEEHVEHLEHINLQQFGGK